jgi:hypothetical protein
MDQRRPKERLRLTRDNLSEWPAFQGLFDDGKVRFDSAGRLRYLHGAPVGDLILVRANKQGQPIYRESAEEWFDPDSPAAETFEWP